MLQVVATTQVVWIVLLDKLKNVSSVKAEKLLNGGSEMVEPLRLIPVTLLPLEVHM